MNRSCICGARASGLLAECPTCYVQRRNREMTARGWRLLPSHLLTARVVAALHQAKIGVELLRGEDWKFQDPLGAGWVPEWAAMLVIVATKKVTPNAVLEAALCRTRDNETLQDAIVAVARLGGADDVLTLALTPGEM